MDSSGRDPLPGFFDTDRIRTTMANAAAKSGKSVDKVLDARHIIAAVRQAWKVSKSALPA